MRTVKATCPPAWLNLAKWSAVMLDAAEKTAAELKVTPEAIVAQAALETGWGKAAIGHNIFGIKADASWHGKTQDVTTREFVNGQYVTIVAPFRDYDSYDASMEDHFSFLKVNGYYKNIFDEARAGKLTDQEYFELLHEDGYATDPHYATSLMNMRNSVAMLEPYIVKG